MKPRNTEFPSSFGLFAFLAAVSILVLLPAFPVQASSIGTMRVDTLTYFGARTYDASATGGVASFLLSPGDNFGTLASDWIGSYRRTYLEFNDATMAESYTTELVPPGSLGGGYFGHGVMGASVFNFHPYWDYYLQDQAGNGSRASVMYTHQVITIGNDTDIPFLLQMGASLSPCIYAPSGATGWVGMQANAHAGVANVSINPMIFAFAGSGDSVHLADSHNDALHPGGASDYSCWAGFNAYDPQQPDNTPGWFPFVPGDGMTLTTDLIVVMDDPTGAGFVTSRWPGAGGAWPRELSPWPDEFGGIPGGPIPGVGPGPGDPAWSAVYDEVPEPGTLLMLGSGLLGAVGLIRRKIAAKR